MKNLAITHSEQIKRINQKMNQVNNFRSTFNTLLHSEGFELTSNGRIKKISSKKIITAKDFFKIYFDKLQCSLTEFELFLGEITQNIEAPKKIKKNENGTALRELLDKCEFFYKKFRWHITEQEKSKIFYLKTHELANEYIYLTNDVNDDRFCNCFDIDKGELKYFLALVNEYNQIPEQEFLTWRKIVKIIIDDLESDEKYYLAQAPQIFTNKFDVAAFKFFDIDAVERDGDEYCQEFGTRPPTPAWDCFFARIRDQSMVPVVKAFIAGLFIDYNKTKQVLYIYGNGNDGKSQITEALQNFMGQRVTYNLPQNMVSNQFTLSGAYGKRMFIGEEMQSPNIIKNGLLHSITGGGIHRIEKKGDDAFSAKIYGVGVVTSNYAPNIADVKNQIARLLYIEMNSADENDINYAGLSWSDDIKSDAEIRGVIYDGLKYFKELNPTGACFKMPDNYQKTLEELFDEKSNHINEFIRDCFEFSEKSIVRDNLVKSFTEFCQMNYFDESSHTIPKEYFDNNVSKSIFEKLKSIYPQIERARKKISGSQYRVISGLKLKEGFNFLKEFLEIE